MTAPAPIPARVVQVRTPHGFGTGYVVGPGLILTAARVVGAPDAPVALARPGGDGVPASGTVTRYRRGERVDAALVTLAGPVPALLPRARSGPATRFGVFVTARARQAVDAIGFPVQRQAGRLRPAGSLAGRAATHRGLGTAGLLQPAKAGKVPHQVLHGHVYGYHTHGIDNRGDVPCQ